MSENCKSIAATSDRAGGNDHRSNDLADIRAFSKANGIPFKADANRRFGHSSLSMKIAACGCQWLKNLSTARGVSTGAN
jgi:hypothetical protein